MPCHQGRVAILFGCCHAYAAHSRAVDTQVMAGFKSRVKAAASLYQSIRCSRCHGHAADDRAVDMQVKAGVKL